MKNESISKQKLSDVKDFSVEYNEIVNLTEKSVVIQTQWEKDGDFFQKISLYDNSYVSIESLGGTTLIKAL
ncbi:MAG: hypothetical protein ABIO44_09025 [Saprospiraceae bacterium]